VVLPGRQMAVLRQFVVLALGRIPVIWGHLLRPGSMLRHIRDHNPSTLAEHRKYIQGKSWVPEEITGDSAKYLGQAGVAYGVTVGRGFKVAGKAVTRLGWALDSLGDRHWYSGVFLSACLAAFLLIYLFA